MSPAPGCARRETEAEEGEDQSLEHGPESKGPELKGRVGDVPGREELTELEKGAPASRCSCARTMTMVAASHVTSGRPAGASMPTAATSATSSMGKKGKKDKIRIKQLKKIRGLQAARGAEMTTSPRQQLPPGGAKAGAPM